MKPEDFKKFTRKDFDGDYKCLFDENVKFLAFKEIYDYIFLLYKYKDYFCYIKVPDDILQRKSSWDYKDYNYNLKDELQEIFEDYFYITNDIFEIISQEYFLSKDDFIKIIRKTYENNPDILIEKMKEIGIF